MTLPETVTTERTTLPLWDAAVIAALRSGERLERWHASFPQGRDLDAAGLWNPGDVWGPRSLVVGGWVVGSVGFFGAPTPAADGIDEVEVGFGIVPEGRGRGLVPEAVGALLRLTDQAVVRVRAAVAPDDKAALRVTAKLGFTDIRGTTETGELVLVRPLR